jgi:cytochrome c oxidase subunit IV
MSETHGFNTNKIFIILFILTALEVGWSFIPFPRWALWGGLLIFAYMKGHLIFTYFMHMKFEGWIVKGLMVPTIPLMMIVVFANMPDTSKNDLLVYPLTTQLDASSDKQTGGKIVELDQTMRARDSEEIKKQHGGGDAGGGH